MVDLTFEQQKELIELEYTRKIDALTFQRETEKLKHQWELESMRIKSTEIRKAQERRTNRRWLEDNRVPRGQT